MAPIRGKTKSTRRAKLRLKDALEVQKLRREIERYRDHYHNGKALIPDDQYEALEDRLRTLSPRDPILSRVGAKVRNGKKVKLRFPMPSLKKVYPGRGAEKWLASNGEFDASDKLDGVSAQHGMLNGVEFLYTRGNGTIGQDISRLLPMIQIGKPREGETIRGELIMPTSNFSANWAERYENPRNLVSSIVNSGEADAKVAKGILFIAHEMVNPKRPLGTAERYLKTRGYSVVPFKHFNRTDVAKLEAYFKTRKKMSRFDLDGLVLTTRGGDSIAFKVEGESKLGVIKEMEWNLSKDGKFSPVAILEKPLRLAGVSVRRVTAINARYVKQEGIGVGAHVLVTRAGDVIPKIVGVRKKGKVEFPENSKWDANKVHLTIVKLGDDDKKVIRTKRLSESLRVLGVPQIRSNAVGKLVDAGYNTILSLFKADDTDFAKAGLGPTQADILYTGLKEARQRATHATMMRASNVFPGGWGLTRFENITSKIPYEKMYSATDARLVKMISLIPGFTEASAKTFVKGFNKYVTFVNKLKWKPKAIKRKKNDVLSGVSVAFTGFRNKTVEEVIKARGGKIASGVNRNTNILVVKDRGVMATVKVVRAKALGVRCMTLEQFATAFGIQM